MFNNKNIMSIEKDMKILIIADLHSVTEEELSKIKNVYYDVCFLLGDIRDLYIKMILQYVDISKIYGIYGNHDTFGVLEQNNVPNIHGKLVEIDGVKFIGFQGSSKYKQGDYPMYTQKESIEVYKKLEKADVLISHDSPYKLYNKDNAHCGLKGITKYLYKNNIKLNIHGHQHINSTITLKNGTTVICVYRSAIIDLRTNEAEILF